MKIYLAAPFTAQDTMRGVRDVLTSIGHEVTSQWLDFVGDGIPVSEINDHPEQSMGHAITDVGDIARSDMFVEFTQYGSSTTGGHHVELGIALAMQKRVIVVGPRENIFQTLPEVEWFDGWRSLARYFAREYTGAESRPEPPPSVSGVDINAHSSIRFGHY
jgi:hypothetical protein